MARHFKQQEIDEFKECFNLYAHKGVIDSSGLLRFVLRSLGYSPTLDESEKLFK